MTNLTTAAPAPRHGLARVLSKLGLCSRSQAGTWVRDGRVRVNGRVQRDPEFPVVMGRDKVTVDNAAASQESFVYIALNKPRGLVVTAQDEKGRATVYSLLREASLPWIGPVGRLDKASEGLLLMSNDTAWAAGITDPSSGKEKTYHVQVRGTPDEEACRIMLGGVEDGGEVLRARAVRILRHGPRQAWLEIVLDEGRNRHIRRMFGVLGFDVVRLVRVAIGELALGDLGKGSWRRLDAAEVEMLRR
ncbi:MAG TPA: pseudouridine synthase [Pinirhizobacter sp.]|uniref:pseudouridine synthase n=1 Tax=Pinirhizobacter sp. TaxID=2950432 RepID=UPI002BDF9DBC|nr:pseudouridine synthase [Pinirhizobacter sp.]HMH67482.1 pseudouridine synthase [Pinirhizobacter sp.]